MLIDKIRLEEELKKLTLKLEQERRDYEKRLEEERTKRISLEGELALAKKEAEHAYKYSKEQIEWGDVLTRKEKDIEARRLKDKIVQLEQNLYETKEAIDKLKRELKAKDIDSQFLIAKSDELDLKLQAEKKRKRAIEQDLVNLKGLEDEVVREKKDKVTWRERADKEERRRASLQSELVKIEEQSRTGAEKIRREYQGKLESLEKEVLNEREDRKKKISEIHMLQEDKDRLQEEVNNLTRDLRKEKETRDTTQQKAEKLLAELESHRGEVEFLKMVIRNIKNKIKNEFYTKGSLKK